MIGTKQHLKTLKSNKKTLYLDTTLNYMAIGVQLNKGTLVNRMMCRRPTHSDRDACNSKRRGNITKNIYVKYCVKYFD